MADPAQTSNPAARRRARAWWLRRRVIAVSLACAVLFFGVITIRMATGQDPLFSGQSGETTTATATRTESEGDEATRGLFGEGEERGFGGAPQGGSGEGLEPLHTGQS